ncbi:MAG TPA: tetratricopeptide repeat protein [Candidatus Baltobacteraceae bacterium]|nr:tetratricopeptide repeat protein [Candidatus Baltobacteraceae bacterium]
MNSRTPEDRHEQAQDLFQQAYRAQMTGDWDRAAELYKASLEILPTAEAHTFLGWTYHFQGKIDDAIAECKRAIEVDPDFGNPYNDIGAYLISQGRLDEAVPWLEQAISAPRYEPRHFPHFNLGRVYLAKGMFNRARDCFQESLRIEPNYTLARRAIENLRRMVN